MATVASFTVAPPAAPSEFGNLVDEFAAAGLAGVDPVVSAGGTLLTCDLGDVVVRFTAPGGFASGPAGTVTGIEVFDLAAGGALVATITGLSFLIQDLLAAARDGDIASINGMLFSGADTMNGGAGHDELFGGLGNDVISGGGWDDILVGDAGGDRLDGGDGDDLLSGGTGNDKLYGRNGSDTVQGGAHNDRLEGNGQADMLIGGTGADTFAYRAAAESGASVAARDTIRDFRSAEGDRIDLSIIDADGALGAVNSFAFIDQAAFSLNTPGQVRWTTVAGGVLVQASTDNDAAAEMSIFLAGVASLAGGDFIL